MLKPSLLFLILFSFQGVRLDQEVNQLIDFKSKVQSKNKFLKLKLMSLELSF